MPPRSRAPPLSLVSGQVDRQHRFAAAIAEDRWMCRHGRHVERKHDDVDNAPGCFVGEGPKARSREASNLRPVSTVPAAVLEQHGSLVSARGPLLLALRARSKPDFRAHELIGGCTYGALERSMPYTPWRPVGHRGHIESGRVLRTPVGVSLAACGDGVKGPERRGCSHRALPCAVGLEATGTLEIARDVVEEPRTAASVG